jgi:hypothetical protein
MKDVLRELKKCETFAEFLKTIRESQELELGYDNGWTWIEYNGEEVEGTGKERFTSSSDILTLLNMAMHDSFYVVTNINGDVIGVADSPTNAASIYEHRYGELPDDKSYIRAFKLNKLHYA